MSRELKENLESNLSLSRTQYIGGSAGAMLYPGHEKKTFENGVIALVDQ